ncbi:MAG: GntR family transcriptional regulator [Clostridiales bacterium]|nr:GntR family transcriptional regulator [Clostridiales bacterium]
MIQLDLSDHRPLYEQIKDKIKLLIINGVLHTDEKIPSVRELAQQLTINPNTIQRAYRDLESEGYIYSIRAKGSFVAPSENVESKVKMKALETDFSDMVRKARFLGVGKQELFDKIDEIFKEVSDDTD